MFTRKQFRRFIDHPATEWAIFLVGVILLLLSPVVGALPGPGGIIVAGIGLAMVLKTSMWARRRYVRFKRWQPKAGRWTDWALRRPSARRREAMRKAEQAAREIGHDNPDAPMSEVLGSTIDDRPTTGNGRGGN